MSFANGYRRAYHYHLKKCGGTSMNAWLDSQVADDRGWNPDWTKPFTAMVLNEGRPPDDLARSEAEFAALARGAFRWSDVIHDHAPLRPFAPGGTFSFTVLRQPVDRILSQVSDWRRLDLARYPDLAAPVAAAMRDAQTLPLAAFLAKHATATFPFLFDNYLTRALAAARLGLGIVAHPEAAALAETATLALRVDFDLVGLTEQQAETQAAVADALGLAPEPASARLNVTQSGRALAQERAEAGELLARLTCLDEPLYALAGALFERRLRDTAAATEARFEARHAAAAVERLEPVAWDGHTAFSVRGPLVGSGFHPRDAAGHETCRLWSGPGTRSVLYLPVPPGVPLAVTIWIHGYAAERQREQLRVEIDDRPALHRFEAAPGWREALVVEAVPHASWLKLALHLDETLTSEAAGQGPGDERPRGVSFDRYGWRPIV